MSSGVPHHADTVSVEAPTDGQDLAFAAQRVVGVSLRIDVLEGRQEAGLRHPDFMRDRRFEELDKGLGGGAVIGDAEQRLALEVGNIASGIQSTDRQREFNTAIRDATEEGLGALRDADLARADARNEQIQVQQQLQFQTLNQQNQQRGSILNLFA